MGWQDRQYSKDNGSGEYGMRREFAGYSITRLTLIMIGVCVGIHLLKSFSLDFYLDLMDWGALRFGKGFRPWQLVTYQYFHGDARHLFGNLVGIFFFMPMIEKRWGWKKTLAFYTMGGVFAGLVFGLAGVFFHRMLSTYLIGASGSIMAIMGACGLLFPAASFILILIMIPLRVAVGLFGVYYLVSALADENLSDACHLGGLVFGFFAPMASPWIGNLRMRWAVKKERDWVKEDQRQQEVVDRILEKVHKEGMNALSSGEKKALKKATEWQRTRERGR